MPEVFSKKKEKHLRELIIQYIKDEGDGLQVNEKNIQEYIEVGCDVYGGKQQLYESMLWWYKD